MTGQRFAYTSGTIAGEVRQLHIALSALGARVARFQLWGRGGRSGGNRPAGVGWQEGTDGKPRPGGQGFFKPHPHTGRAAPHQTPWQVRRLERPRGRARLLKRKKGKGRRGSLPRRVRQPRQRGCAGALYVSSRGVAATKQRRRRREDRPRSAALAGQGRAGRWRGARNARPRYQQESLYGGRVAVSHPGQERRCRTKGRDWWDGRATRGVGRQGRQASACLCAVVWLWKRGVCQKWHEILQWVGSRRARSRPRARAKSVCVTKAGWGRTWQGEGARAPLWRGSARSRCARPQCVIKSLAPSRHAARPPRHRRPRLPVLLCMATG